MSDAETLRREKKALESRFGPWTAHNLRLANGLYTIGPEPSGDEVKLRRVVQIVSDLHGGEFRGLRVLDLACLEGMYAIELASRGAEVVAIEGREANLAKARFAAAALELDRIRFVQGDVRDLSPEQHGRFDVVLCLGILYHLDVTDVFALVERMEEVCEATLVIDTHVALSSAQDHVHDGRTYRGRTLFEHDPSATEEERLRMLWSSLDNPIAFAPTRASLLALLARSGFTSVYECHVPAEPEKAADRITLVARKGTAQEPVSSPAPQSAADAVAETASLSSDRPLLDRARFLVPRPLRVRLRRLAGTPERRY